MCLTNWDQHEAEHNKQYDPYPELVCDICDAEKIDLCICVDYAKTLPGDD